MSKGSRSPARTALSVALAASVLATQTAQAAYQPYFRLQAGQDAAGAGAGPTGPGPGTGTTNPANPGTGPTTPSNPGTGIPTPVTTAPGTTGPSDLHPLTASGSGRSLRQDRAASFSPATAGGGSGSFSWSIAQGPLPDGMSLAPNGLVSGTPTRANVYPVSLRASDTEGRVLATNVFPITVVGHPTLAYASVKVPLGENGFGPSSQTNVIGPAQFSSVGAPLPNGLQLNPSTGFISGTASTPGLVPGIQVALIDADGDTATSAPFSIEVSASGARLYGQSDSVRLNVPYTMTLQREGLVEPIAYSIAGSPWPLGLTLQAGKLAGTPAQTGTFQGLAVHAKDANDVEVTSPPFQLTVTQAYVSNPGTIAAPLNKDLTKTLGSANLLPGASWVVSGTLPPGLRVDGGVIKGVPTVAGSYPGISVTAVDAGGSFSTGEFTINVIPDSLAVLASSVNVRKDAFATIAAKTQPAFPGTAWTVSGDVPAGMALDPNTGVLSGTPAANAAAIVLKATANGLTGTSAPLSVTVYPALSASAAPVGAMVAKATDQAFAASGVIGTATWRMVSGTLPDGLYLRTDGHVVGTPTTAGSVSGLVAQVTDNADGSIAVTQPFTATVAASDRMLVTGLSGVYGTRVNRLLALPAPTVQNAQGTPTFDVSTPLPAGIAIDKATGVISGTATNPGNGEPVQVVASDQRPSTAASPSFAVRLVGPLALTGVGDVTAKVGQYLTSSVSAQNLMGQGQYALLPEGTTLPAGLRFESLTGRILGRPTVAGTLSGLSLQVTDTVDGETATSAPFTLAVTPGLVVDGPSVLGARVGQPFDSGNAFVVGNATTPVTWRVSAGTLPRGLGLDVLTGRITGTPAEQVRQAGIILHVDGQDGLFGESQPFAIDAAGAMGITVGSTQKSRINAPMSIAPAATNNVGAVTWNIGQGASPPGMNFDARSGRIYGVPATAGTFGPIRLHAKDSIGQEATSDPITVTVGDQLRITKTYNPPDSRLNSTIVPYNPFVVTGAVGSYSVVPNNLPTSMTMAADGTLSGKWGAGGCCWFLTATVTDSTGAKASADFTLSGIPDKPYLSGRDYPWTHTPSTSYGGVTGKGYSFYTNSGPGIEGTWDSGRRHFELSDPSQLQPWMTFHRDTGDISGTPTTAGTYKVDVVIVDDVDGARSTPHTYTMPIADLTKVSNDGAVHIRTRINVGIDRKLIDTANGSFTTRPAGWCRSNVPANNKSGLWLNLRDDCSVWNYSWDVATVGTYDGYYVEATDDAGVVHHVDFDVQIAPPLSVTTGQMACTRTPGDTLTATAGSIANLIGNPVYTLTDFWGNPTQLPAGMSFDPSSGSVSGILADFYRATNGWGDRFRLNVTDDWDGSAGYAMLGFEYRRPLGSFYTGPRQIGYKRWDSFGLGGSGIGYPLPASWQVSSGALPPGMAFSGDIFGTNIQGAPTKVGAYDVTLRVTTDCPSGTTYDVPFHIDVVPSIAITAPNSVTMREGVASVTTPAPSVEYGKQPVNFYLPCCWNLPQGITMDPGTGQLTGTPAAGTAGTYDTMVRAADSSASADSAVYKLVILPAPGLSYDTTVTARVATPLSVAPQTYNVDGPAAFASSGTPLPADLGVSIDPGTGNIVGSPTRTGRFANMKVAVKDASGLSGSSNTFTIDVSNGPGASIDPSFQATMGTAFAATPTASGTIGAVTWSLAAGDLPLGLSVDPASGAVGGTPVTKGTFAGLALAATDSTGAVATTNAFTITVGDGTVSASGLSMGCNNAQNGSILNGGTAAGSGGSGGAGAGGQPWNGSSSGGYTPDVPTCLVNLWDMQYSGANSQYVNWKGSAFLYDTEGQRTRSLGLGYDWIKVVDVATGREFASSADITWVMSNFVTGAGDFSRRFYAVAKVSGSNQVRTSGQFDLTGSYGGTQTVITADPNDPANAPHWFWDRQQCITTCNSYGVCDARQYQVCHGSACPAPSRTCYQVYVRGTATSQPIGTETTQCIYPQYGGAQEYCP